MSDSKNSKDSNELGLILDQDQVWENRFRKLPPAYKSLPFSSKTRDAAEFLMAAGASDVLDIGCGPGRWSILFARLGMRPVGLDISATAIKLAEEWALEEDLDARFAVGTAQVLPFPVNSFDAVVASAVIDHLDMDEANEAVKEISRVLRPGGALFVSFDGPHLDPPEHHTLPDGTWIYQDEDNMGLKWRYYNDEEIKELLAGFEVLSWQATPSGDRLIYARQIA